MSLENVVDYVDIIDENGNISIEVVENNKDLLQGFTIRANRKQLRRLMDAAAYNTQYLSCESDVDFLGMQKKQFIVTYSGDYISALNKTGKKEFEQIVKN